MTSATTERSLHRTEDGVMHQLWDLISRQDPTQVNLVRTTKLSDIELIDIDRRHRVALTINQKFTRPQSHADLMVTYVPEIECFLAVNMKTS